MTLVAHINLARGFRGGERQTELLVRGLAGAGWRQRAVVRQGEPLAARLAGIPGLEIAGVAGGILQAVRALRGADLVHVHEARALQAAWLNAITGGAPYLVTRRVQQGPSHHWLNRVMYRRAARLVVLSQAIGAALRALDPGLSWVVIPSASAGLPVDRERSAAIRARFGAGFLVGHIGALVDAHKGQRQIIDVARDLQRRAPDAGFVLVGSGRDEAALREAAAGLGNLHFAGEVSDVGSYLAAFDVFLYPSRHEGLGSVLLDAMACGLPVVATGVGGIPEIVPDGEAGFLCEPGDIAALAAAILALHGDRDLCRRIGAANRERSRSYTPQAMTQRYLDIYRELLPAGITVGNT
ncbi:MAG: glycosyltransferase family 4 protein [Gammaproteobacteria bacterium]|nr:glycosyltransferase family 4 protein [Gammaproteobacteria bacterium]